jgi:hypothetical protein
MVGLDFFFASAFMLLDHPSFAHSTNPKIVNGWFPNACEMYKCYLQICGLSHLFFVLQLKHADNTLQLF